MLLLAVVGITWGNTELCGDDIKCSSVVVEDDWLRLRGGIALDLVDELEVDRRACIGVSIYLYLFKLLLLRITCCLSLGEEGGGTERNTRGRRLKITKVCQI